LKENESKKNTAKLTIVTINSVFLDLTPALKSTLGTVKIVATKAIKKE
jgi:hypothetical protein